MHRIRLILLGLVLATLAVGCPHVSVLVPNAAPAQTLPPVPPRVLATGGADPFAWYANERAANFFYVTDPTMAGVGAKGDNTTDDTAAIVAADAAAKAVLGTVVFPPPSVCYKTTAELGMHWPGHWKGFAQNVTQPTICAHGSGFRSVVEVRSTFGYSGSATTPGPLDNAPSRGLIEDITIDAGAGGARTGILLNGSEYFRLRNVHVNNAIEHGIRNASIVLPQSLGSVTVGGTGGSPTVGMAFTQADANYINSGVFPVVLPGVGTLTLVLRIVNPGALGTATYQLSLDGGSTYESGTWPLQSVFATVDSNANGTQASLGVLGHFPAGTYLAGTTYSVTLTTAPADINEAQAANDSTILDTVSISNSGTTYATAGLTSLYGGFTQSLASGTVSTVATSNMVVGSGTHFLTGMQGCNYGVGAIKVGGNFYAIAAVLDDTDLATVDSTPVTTTGSGLDFAMSCTAGYYEDGANENAYNQWIDGTLGQNSIGMVFQYEQGPTITGLHNNSSAVAGFVIGGPVDHAITQMTMIGVQQASGTVGAGHGVPYIISSHTNGTMISPIANTTFVGLPTQWTLIRGGVISPLVPYGNSIYAALTSETFNFQPVNVTSAGQQISPPDLAIIGSAGFNSYQRLQLSGTYTMSATPVIPPVSEPGTVLILENGSVFQSITFRDDADTSSGLLLSAPYVTLQYQDVIVFMSGGPPPLFSKWKELYVSRHYAVPGLGTLGDIGEGTNRVQTVSSTTPVPIYCLTTTLANSNALKWDLVATSASGANVAKWTNYEAGWTPPGTQFAFMAGGISGTGSGNTVPLGWAMTVDGNSGTPCIRVAGDSSSNPVTWTIVAQMRDPGQ